MWLLEPEVFGDDEQLFVHALKQKNIPYTEIKFGLDYSSYANTEAILHGSFQAAKVLNNSKVKIHGRYPQLYDCTNYYPQFGYLLLNQNYYMLPFGELYRRMYSITDVFGEEFFIRPNRSTKPFAGMVVHSNDYNTGVISRLKTVSMRMDHYELVVVAPKQTILAEYRFIVVDRKIITGCQYKPNRLQATDEILQKAQDVLHVTKFNPEKAWVLDLANIDDEQMLKVLEVGPFSCCGFYNCDYNKIIEAIP